MSRELLQRCLNRFIRVGYEGTLVDDLEEYLASEKQDQPQPVAWRVRRSVNHEWLTVGIEESASHCKDSGWIVEQLYLHPTPKRSFVRLSEEEIKEVIEDLLNKETWNWMMFARAIEDASKEKNK